VAPVLRHGLAVNYWRIDLMTDDDFEWFERKNPGGGTTSRQVVGALQLALGAQRAKPIAFEDTGYVSAPLLTCMVPCLIREDIVMDEVDGQVLARAPATGPTRWRSGGEGRETPAMGRPTGKREWRPSTTVGIWPIYRKISATSVTTGKHSFQPHVLRRQEDVDA